VSRFRPPVRSKGDGFVIDIGADESALVVRLLGELRALLTDPDPGPDARVLLGRLFPTAYPDDDELEAEYQRLMREELVQSRLAAIDAVERVLTGNGRVDEAGLTAFMQSVNAIRLILGTMLDVTDDEPDRPEPDIPEYQLYGYLSWLLEWAVRAAA
jgi:hypothetical protein